MTVFLDVDGVLNKESDWRIPFTINRECLTAFSSFCKKLKVTEIVLTSTWRAGISKTGNNSKQINELINRMAEQGLSISGYTPVTAGKTRAEEIDYYARRHGITHFIAIDDDPGLYEGKVNVPLYVTNYKTGFTEKDIFKAMKTAKNKRRTPCIL